MEKQKIKISLEEYVRGKLNVSSGRGTPLNITDKEYADNIAPNLFASMRNKFNVLSNLDLKGVNLEPANVENFSISPMPFENSPGYKGIVGFVREYYESQDMVYDEKASTPSRSNPDPPIWFKTPEGKGFYVTYTPGFLDKNNMEMLFSTAYGV